ncbi:hypothetical protein [Snodgrassella alvi]|jgi:hypothetical protein|uniref:Uncharacterized protein n=1 Tax=Snodgrassella alvi TaxID=1196083 RepID=A0A855FZG5_9NEIS|nr:hypothetical protein [Snodgrassella alvi]PIT45868.1 hypothetical protein BHC51_07840 [Snodgrassella alvi]PIT62254.1 hypothetical protein BHC57_01205 [Snodgrassella alvi]
MTILFQVCYVTYSYHGNKDIALESPDSEDFDTEIGQILGFYSTYEKALERKKFFSKSYYLSNLKRLEIYDTTLDSDWWRDGFVTI